MKVSLCCIIKVVTMVTRGQQKQSCTDVGVTDLAISSISMTENDVNKTTTYLMMILYFVEKDFVILSCVSMLRL